MLKDRLRAGLLLKAGDPYRLFVGTKRYYEGLFVICPLELKREFVELDLTEGERNECVWNSCRPQKLDPRDWGLSTSMKAMA